MRRHPFLCAGPFAATLARQLAALCSAGKLLPESSLWKAAVDGFLLRAASISMEVHEEVRRKLCGASSTSTAMLTAHAQVLRLLLAAASAMTPTCLAQSLEAALQNTRRSRKQHKRRRVITEYEYEPGAKTARPRLGESVPAGYSSPGGGYASSDASDGSSGFGRGKVRLPRTPRCCSHALSHSACRPTPRMALEPPTRSSPPRRPPGSTRSWRPSFLHTCGRVYKRETVQLRAVDSRPSKAGLL